MHVVIFITILRLHRFRMFRRLILFCPCLSLTLFNCRRGTILRGRLLISRKGVSMCSILEGSSRSTSCDLRTNHLEEETEDLLIFFIYAKVPHGLLDHVGNDSWEQRRAELQAWIGVDLDEPRFELLIDHKIHTQELEIMFPPLRIQAEIGGFDGIKSQHLHFW